MNQWSFQRFSKDDFRKVPNAPGIYKYLNAQQEIIYVGKAKDLRKRVSSYFLPGTQHTLKTAKLVREVKEIEFVIVNSEAEALLLENTLIKEYQPRYNIMLKDGKSYPFICILKERFPRVISTRRVNINNGEYFGPFTSVRSMHNVLNLIKRLYKIRTCNLNLSAKNIDAGKFKVCLEYHIGNCLGPCAGLQSEEAYNREISEIRDILKGNLTIVKKGFRSAIETAVAELRFEDAQIIKEKLESVDQFQSKSLVVNPKITETDVFTISSIGKKSFVNYMRIGDGMIKLSETIEVQRKLDETENEILPLVIFNLRRTFNSTNKLILTNIAIDTWEDVEIQIPRIGDKKQLVELSRRNVDFYIKNLEPPAPTISDKILEQLRQDLKIDRLPKHIECFDNSNIQGTNPVASMVCFKNGRPAKKEYRKFRIRTVEGPDDFESMKEIVTRRYKRLMEEESPLPDLILIDGGKGQLAAACEALENLNMYGDIPIVGIAKRLEEIYQPNDPYPIHINKKSSSLKLLQRIRDEAHRFAITFHRDSRSKTQTVSQLDQINGIGEKTRKILLTQYKSITRIRQASITELAQFVGLTKAQLIHKALNKKEGQ